MNLSNDEAVKTEIKKFCRITIKYTLMILLIILTVVMIIGAICQQNVAAIGYVGILIMTFLTMRYPFKQISPNY